VANRRAATTTISPMEHKYGYESCLPYAVLSTTTTELEKESELPAGTGDGFQPRENATPLR
jgi:hypothetical protein